MQDLHEVYNVEGIVFKLTPLDILNKGSNFLLTNNRKEKKVPNAEGILVQLTPFNISNETSNFLLINNRKDKQAPN